MGVARRIGEAVQALTPTLREAAPELTTTFVGQALQRAIDGFGPLTGAELAAESALKERRGDVDRAIRDVIEVHVRWSTMQGFATNVGGITTLPVTISANVAGLTLLQCRMVAAIAHLRGYDLADKRVRNGILTALLGEETVHELIDKQDLPGTPMAIATAPVYDVTLDSVMATQVASVIITKVAGKRLATSTGKRIPFLGGFIGAGTDAAATWKIGRYVEREFLQRPRIVRSY